MYEGFWELNKIEGEGRYFFKNQDYYQGHFENDKMHGKGIMYFADGTVKKGQWENDQFVDQDSKLEFIENYQEEIKEIKNEHEEEKIIVNKDYEEEKSLNTEHKSILQRITADSNKLQNNNNQEEQVQAESIRVMNYFSASEKKTLSVKSIKINLKNSSDKAFISKYSEKPPMIGIQALFIYIDDQLSNDLIRFLDNIEDNCELLYLGILNINTNIFCPIYCDYLLKVISKTK